MRGAAPGDVFVPAFDGSVNATAAPAAVTVAAIATTVLRCIRNSPRLARRWNGAVTRGTEGSSKRLKKSDIHQKQCR
ncbi:hypothetical protein KRMM14A1259_28640 [Krasilnikovia sp. MM14-A1259]